MMRLPSFAYHAPTTAREVATIPVSGSTNTSATAAE